MEIDEVVSVRNREYLTTVSARWLSDHSHVDEAFAAKHMPDLGHDIKDFQVYTWHLENWKKLDKKLTSPEFECGGHKWCVSQKFLWCPVLTALLSPGVYYSFPLAIPTLLQTIQFLSILTMQNPRKHQKDGTLARNLLWSFLTHTILPSAPSAVGDFSQTLFTVCLIALY